MDIKLFFEELYASHQTGVNSNFINENWNDVLTLLEDNVEIIDGLNALAAGGNKKTYDNAVEQLLMLVSNGDDLSDYTVLPLPSVEETITALEQENAELKQRQELAEEALLALSDMLLSR